MLVRKSVCTIDNRLHLWNEANAYVHSYDRLLDQEMCAFLDRMVELDIYTRRSAPDDQSFQDAA